ncbi:ATP-grasp domain-containing protein [Kordiimonas sp.]|uniref:ATP-grasp domain-containing protein n=1 Tax=Kordiimonas sp. TaxID=1970157 RepID=UPI003A8D5CCF
MVEKRNILVFPCGSEIGLEVHAALKYEKSTRLFGASSVEDHGRMVFRRHLPLVPMIGADDFDERFEQLLVEHEIDVVVPAHDSVLLYLAENRAKFSAEILAPSAEVCGICRSKRNTYDALEGEAFIPRYYADVADIPTYPVFLKPDVGQGSQGVVLAKSEGQCREALAANPGLLICEYLPGDEYTVDCFTDKNGELLFCSPRQRMRTKAGISVRSRNVDLGKRVEEIARRIATRLNMHGTWFFQLKHAADGTLKLLEVAPRVAGAMAVHRVMGVNFILLSLFELAGRDIAVQPKAFKTVELERALINRYLLSVDYDVVYLDLDDTLIVDGEVNDNALTFLYQCRKKGIKVKLITRHYQEPGITLDAFAIHEVLFDKIIWISDKRPKSSFMQDGERALFIDDSFAERSEVMSVHGFPCLGPDAIEALLDWRR